MSTDPTHRSVDFSGSCGLAPPARPIEKIHQLAPEGYLEIGRIRTLRSRLMAAAISRLRGRA